MKITAGRISLFLLLGLEIRFSICFVSCSNVLLFLPRQIIAASKIVEERQEILQPFNILPLDAAGASQAIIQLPEVNYLDS